MAREEDDRTRCLGEDRSPGVSTRRNAPGPSNLNMSAPCGFRRVLSPKGQLGLSKGKSRHSCVSKVRQDCSSNFIHSFTETCYAPAGHCVRFHGFLSLRVGVRVAGGRWV